MKSQETMINIDKDNSVCCSPSGSGVNEQIINEAADQIAALLFEQVLSQRKNERSYNNQQQGQSKQSYHNSI